MHRDLYNKLRKIADDGFNIDTMSSGGDWNPYRNPEAAKMQSDIAERLRQAAIERNRALPVDFDSSVYAGLPDAEAYDRAVHDYYGRFTPPQRTLFRTRQSGEPSFDRSPLASTVGSSWLDDTKPTCNLALAGVLHARHGKPIMQNPGTGRLYTAAELNAIADSENPMLGGFRMQPLTWDEAKNESGVVVLDPKHMGIRVNHDGNYRTFNSASSRGLSFSDWGDPSSKLTKRPTRFFRLVKDQQ